MAKIDELNAAVSTLQATADQVVAKIDELKAGGTALDPQIEAATAAISGVSDKLNAAIATPPPPA